MNLWKEINTVIKTNKNINKEKEKNERCKTIEMIKEIVSVIKPVLLIKIREIITSRNDCIDDCDDSYKINLYMKDFPELFDVSNIKYDPMHPGVPDYAKKEYLLKYRLGWSIFKINSIINYAINSIIRSFNLDGITITFDSYITVSIYKKKSKHTLKFIITNKIKRIFDKYYDLE